MSDTAFASILVALIVTAGSVWSVSLQRRVAKDNRSDHSSVSSQIAALRDDVNDVKADVREIKTDVRGLRAADSDAATRLDDLERTREGHTT
jgi:septal ring factor EnvC (AmiA/AmiB activator)